MANVGRVLGATARNGRLAALAIVVVAAAVGQGRAQESAAAAAADSTQTPAAGLNPAEPAVRELIERYFRTWSAQDIDRYGQCFAPQAAIQLLGDDGRLTTMSLRRFLQSQRDAHRSASAPMKETPETVDVRFEGNVTRVVVYWKLVAGANESFGYDHFTLVNVRGEWRVANLLFYETPAK